MTESTLVTMTFCSILIHCMVYCTLCWLLHRKLYSCCCTYSHRDGNCGATCSKVVCTTLAHSATTWGLSVRPVTAVSSICSLSMGNQAHLFSIYPWTIRDTKPCQDFKVDSDTGFAARTSRQSKLQGCAVHMLHNTALSPVCLTLLRINFFR